MIDENVNVENQKRAKYCWCGGQLVKSIRDDYLRCSNCGTFVSKAEVSKDRLEAFYSYDGYWHDYVENLDYPNLEQRGEYLLANRIPAWFEMVKRHKPDAKYLLEIGCAEGSFLYYCKQKGVEHVVGIEVDPRTCEYAKRNYQLENIYPGLYPDVKLPYEKYDVIAGFDVLEHFIDPVSALKHIHEDLKDDGIAIFQTPRYRNDGTNWLHFKPNEHLFLLDGLNARLLFDRCGFDVVSVTKGSLAEDMNIVVKKKINVDALTPRPVNLISDRGELKTHERKKIAIGLIEHFGDIVACEPVSRFVRSENLDAYIVWCLRKEYQDLVISNPHIDEVVTVDCLTEWIALKESGIYDEIVDLHIDGRVCPVCRIPLQKEVAFSVNGDNYYKVGNLLSAFSKGAGLPALDGSPRVYITESARHAVDDLRLPSGFVVIHAKTNEVDRDWNDRGWKDLVSYIQSVHKLQVVEIGDDSVVAKLFPRGAVNFIGRRPYLEIAEIIRRARLFIGVDSGPAHLANAVRTRGVIILGAYRNFKRYLPYSGYYTDEENASLIYNPDGPASDVPSEAVIQAFDKMLLKTRSKKSEQAAKVSGGSGPIQESGLKNGDVKIIAFYLPQFHPIPENDRWWGKGFTEWHNVVKGRPLYPGHYQPQIPADLGFYDLRLNTVFQDQVTLATHYGIDGFCFWHYWFNGKLLLEKPLVNLLSNKDYQLPFCLSWANENWTKRWDGQEREVLMPQTYGSEEDIAAHFNWLLPFFKDERYITIDRKPIFLIYRPKDIPNIAEMIEIWNRMSRGNGFDGIYLIAVATSFERSVDYKAMGFDGELLFQPQFSQLFEKLREQGWLSSDKKSIIFDYEEAVNVMKATNKDFSFADDDKYVTVLPGWDNASRRVGLQAFGFRNPSPLAYESWLREEIDQINKRANREKRLIFINAWNEWGEGAHLEPDQKFGKRFLEATARARKVTNEFCSLVDWTYPIDNEKILSEVVTFAETSKTLGKNTQAEYYYRWGLRITARSLARLRHSAIMHNAMEQAAGQADQYADLIMKLYSGLNSTVSKPQEHHNPTGNMERLLSVIVGVNVKKSIDDAERLIESGNLDAAKSILEKLLDKLPQNVDALNDLAVIKILQNKYQEAHELLKRIISIDPENQTAKRNIEVLLQKLSQVYNGLKEKSENKALHDFHDDIARAEDLISSKAYSEAESVLNEVIASFPYNVDALNDLAVVYAMQGKVQESLEKFRAVLQIDPNNQVANDNVKIVESIVNAKPENSLTAETGLNPVSSSENDSLPLVSIIIPVFNKIDFTKKCLQAVAKNTEYSNYEVIILDNGSTDGTKEFLDQLCGSDHRIKVKHSDENLGFVKGCNLAAESARGKYILFLNNDTEVQPGWLSALVEFAETHEDCGAVGSKLVYPDGTLQEAGGIIFSDGEGWNFGRGGHPMDPAFNYVREVDYCSGASLMVKANLWNKIGGFDLRYAPAYYEDSDLCFEIRKLGYKVYYNYKSMVIHHEGKTSGTVLTEGFKRYQLLNKSKFVDKWSKELTKQYAHDPANVIAASDRGVTGNVLVFDDLLPMPDRAAGSKFCYNAVSTLRDLDYHVTFVAVSPSLKEKYEDGLRQKGVETYSSDPRALSVLHGIDNNFSYDSYALLRRKRYDLAFINFWYVAEYYLPIIRRHFPETKIIVISHDVHFNRELREATVKNDQVLIQKAEATKIRELKVYDQSDIVWVVSESEKELLSAYINPSKIQIVTHVEEAQQNNNGLDGRQDLLFVGNFNHRPNTDGVLWFAKEILPQVLQRLPNVKLYIVGNNPPTDIVSLRSENIVVTGYVQDLAQYLSKARVSIAPLRYGGGVKGKVLEAMGAGLPVVSTRIGAEGIELVPGEHCLITDDPNQFAEYIISLYTDAALWSKLSENGRRLVKERYSLGRLKEDIQRTVRLLSKSEASTLSQLEKRPNALTSLVVVTYNGLNYTRQCVASIQKYTKVPYELIFVDNNSKDGTREYLKRLSRQMKNVRVIYNSDNKGFPFACNQGIAIAKGKYILLLNSDVIVTEKWLEGLIERAESDESFGIVGPMTNRISGYQMDLSAKYSDQLELKRFAADYRKRNLNRWTEVRRVAGFCMLIKREVIDRIGGLDPMFGVGNCEDDDYCLRASKAGYRTVIAQDVFIHHYGGGSFLAAGKENYLNILEKNSSLFKEKWGVSETEWWMGKKEPTKFPDLFVGLPDPSNKANGNEVEMKAERASLAK
jgi:GT2 family glycosyltransferase/glycosyltransferase involved in cell wall biosynthesis/ADP-heptose:LPS heptosyltransferase/2-polyprenyl-3-methyl-5-hydroxy-6-metoxy-1,4-benzoquinol methylase/thioredoxin-like negative regulator of GroEL